MKVQEAMSRIVQTASSDDSIRDAATAMFDLDAGVLPVSKGDRLVGMITDRDIAVRAVAAGLGPETPVEDVMTEGVCYCFEDQDIREVTNNMKDIKVRRLPVINREKRLVGILALGDIVRSDGHGIATAQALAGICQPGGMHSQSGESDSDVTSIG